MRDDGTGLLENLGSALRIAWALATPFLRGRRVRWGATEAERSRRYPGDDLVPHPRWQFLHAIDIDAPALEVRPWIAQVGQGRGGFYSYERSNRDTRSCCTARATCARARSSTSPDRRPPDT